jgi:formylglycine-generating enzyme required for sulfatase activity
MLNKYCLGCHNEKNKKGNVSFEKGDNGNWRKDRSYLNLVAFVRRPGPESDLDMFNPMEWHASTSPLIRMLTKGHYGIETELDAEAWSRLYTWIDLNAPHRGMWNNPDYERKRLDLAKLYAGVSDNPEQEHRRSLEALKNMQIDLVMPSMMTSPGPDGLKVAGFGVDAAQAARLQGDNAEMAIELTSGITMQLVRIPAGKFVMGSRDGAADEAPRAVVNIDKPFWMGATEVTNAQYAAFDPDHDTRYLDEHGKDHSVPGYIANHPDQPVARVSWREATAFCKWLSKRTGKNIALPTEAQWEWAARAGAETQFFYGDANTDFSGWANLADASRRRTYVQWDGGSKVHVRRDYPADYLYPLRDDRFTDKWFIVDYVKQYQPNPWGLYDIIGNVSEWTRTSYRPYPYKADSRNNGSVEEKKVARGGSWADRPKNAGSAVRFEYQSHQKVYNVGFRIIIEQ